MMGKQVYTAMNVHVPTNSHEKLMKAVTQSRPVSVKLNLTEKPKDKIYVTSGQMKKIQEAVGKGRKDMTLRFSQRQAKHNIQAEGGFLGSILSAAARFLPAILAGLSAGSDVYHKQGNGMFLGKRDHTYQVRHSGEGLLISPSDYSKTRGFYVKHEGNIYQGKGLLHGLFGQIPLLNLLF